MPLFSSGTPAADIPVFRSVVFPPSRGPGKKADDFLHRIFLTSVRPFDVRRTQ